jgi:hypothetical protein
LLLPDADASIASSAQTTAHVLDALKDCPTASYVVVEQRGVSSADYADGRAAPVLTQYMAGKHKQVRSAFALPDVLGQVDSHAILSHLESKCGHKAGLQVMAAPSAETSPRSSSLQEAGTLKSPAPGSGS